MATVPTTLGTVATAGWAVASAVASDATAIGGEAFETPKGEIGKWSDPAKGTVTG